MDGSDIGNPLLPASDFRDGMPLLAESDYSESVSEGPTKKDRISEPVKYFVSIGMGILFGVVLNVFNVSDDMVTVVTIPGALFLRALQCAVIPMMFFNITTSVVDIFGSGSASSIGKRAITLYTMTTFLSVCEGIAIANAFAFLLTSDEGITDDDDGVKVTMQCPKDLGTMTVDADGNMVCVHHDDLQAYNLTTKYQNFHLRDEEDQLINGVLIKQSLVDQVQTTAFSVVPNNFTAAFAIPNIVSVIVIGFIFGAAIVSLQRRPRAAGGTATVLSFCKEMSDVTNEIIGWVIALAPICIGFLIAASLASAGHIIDLLKTVGVYVFSVMVGLLLHTLVVLPALFYWFTGGHNPYRWLYIIKQPLIVAFSTASSAATLPVSIHAAVSSGEVEENTANTLLPMGATINMDGAAIGYPCAISFMAHAARLEGKLNIATWINVGLGSSLGSAGAAPVPNAGIVMLVTVWETAFPGISVPDAVAYVQGIEFIVDRFQTATNVCSDLFILRMIQSAIDRERKSSFIENVN